MRKSFVFIAAVLLILSSCSGGADGGMDVLDTTPEHSEEVFQDAEILEYYENAEPEEALYDSKDVNDEVKLYVEELISAGKAHLANAEPYLALQEFEKALEIDPENVDAIFGAALAELIDATELMMMVFLMTSQFSDPPPVGGESFADESFRRYHRGKDSAPTLHITSIFSPSQNDYFAEEIHNIFMRLRSHFEDALKRLEKIEGKPLNFDVEKAPVYFYTKPVLIYRGAFTGGDVYLMESIVECVLGIFEFLAGQDLRTDVLTMVHFVKSNVGDFNLKELIKLLAYLINEGDTFLSLHPADGENLFYAAKEHFADVSIKLHKALDEIAAEEGSGDRVSSVTEGKNGEKILKIRNGVAEILGDAVIEKELEFVLSKEILAGFERASKSILNAGEPVTLHGGVVPVLAVMINVAGKLGIFTALGLELPVDLGSFDIDALATFLKSLMPNVMAFDWGAFYGKPTGLSAWMPDTTKKSGMDNMFVMEWECPGDIKEDGFPGGSQGLFCAKEAELIDSKHFTGTSYEITEDGKATDFPYFIFKDPTWSDLVLVNLDDPVSDGTDASKYEKADLKSLNSALREVMSGLLFLLSFGD